ncbi:hypothetical protein BGX26_000131 [Mortierella sp. AD094]|nr:hypothetical protein BGX26_000131 [Mortierella sp. AD094]
MVSTTSPIFESTYKTAVPGTSTNSNVPVLIVGAGPTGLFAAILLTKMGIPCRLIERQHEVSKLSKALVIHARTLEIFQMVESSGTVPAASSGHSTSDATLLDRFLQEGQALADFHVYYGKKLYSILPVLRNTESRFEYGIFIEQSRTVAILTEEFEKLGGRVDRGWELMDTKVIEEESANGKKSWVETTIRRAKVGTNIRSTESKILGAVELEADQAGKEYDVEVVRSEYLIAADGGKSAVRHKLNISFEGRTLDNNMIIYDGHVNSDIPLDHISVVHGDCGRVVTVFPLDGNRVRVMVDRGTLTPEEHQAQKSEELTLPIFQEILDETIAPVKMELTDCDWLTYYRVNERLASRYSHKGRIFLSGDAAHVHSPAGGQGLNMGLQDAFNSTWKLSLALKGQAPRSILDTYEIERPKVASDIIKLSSNIFGNATADGIFYRSFRRLVFFALPYILPRVPHGPPMCMLRIRYHENSLNQRHAIQAVPAEEYQVGVRARDGELRVIGHSSESPSEQSLRLHDLLVGPGVFHILVFTSDMLAKTRSTASTTSCNISKSAEDYLATWRTKWVAPSSLPSASSQETLFMIHTISGTPVDTEAISKLDTKKFGEGKLYLDEQGILHQKYGVAVRRGQGSIVVLRPDSHIGYRVQGANESAWEDVNGYFKSILTGTAEPKL